jgi:outer membrane protein
MKGRFSKLTLSLVTLGAVSTGFATNLMDVYQQASLNDPTYKGANATYLSAKENMPLAFAALLPTVTGTANYIKANSSTNPSHYWAKNWGATLTQSIFSWSSFAGISEAKASVRAALATYEAAKQTLIQTTIAAYLTVVKDAATVEYDQTYTNQLLEFLKQQKQKYNVGIIAVTDVYQAQSKYDTQVATNIADKNTLDSDIESLRAITGQAYPSIKGVDTSLPLHSPNPNDMEKWVSTALNQNLGIIAARANVDASKATVSADVGANLPSVGLTGSYAQSYMADKDLNLPGQNHNTSGIAIGLSVPIFSGGSMFAQARKDSYTQEANQQALDSALSTTIAATRTNYMAVMAAISSVQAAKQSYISADESLKAVQAGYQVGTNTITDVLTDMSTRVQAQEGIVTNQVAYLNAIIALKQGAGTLNDDDVQAISSLLNKTVVLPDTLSRKSYGSDSTPNQATSTSEVPSTATEKPVVKAVKKVEAKKAIALPSNHSIIKKLTPSKNSLPYSIQLFVSKNEAHAKTFMNNSLDDSSQTYISTFVNHGQTFYAVMMGHYATHAEATIALSHLPASIQALKPWVKEAK